MHKPFLYKGHMALKCFSQHFLHNSYIIKSIITAIQPKLGQAMVEIGPGLGALTEPMSEYVNTMTAIEIDRNLVARLAANPLLKHKLNIIQQDAMKFNFNKLVDKLKKPLRIFGNLPYHVSTQMILNLFRYIESIQDMHFMLQKEVADRLMAAPNNKNYGRLSIIAQYYCNIVPIIVVPSKSFRPAPKVESILIRLEPYPKLPYLVKDLSKLEAITKLAFNHRRKTIRNNLSDLFTIEQLAQNSIDSMLRAENLSIQQYYHLANVLADRVV